MLYNNFIVCVMTCAFFALLSMIVNHDWEYIILPIGILIWGIFKFFDENDREYLRRRGFDPDEYSIFSPNEFDETYPTSTHKTTKQNASGNETFDSTLYVGRANDYTRYQPKVQTRQDPRYNGMVKKCKRNFIISVSNEDNNKNESGTKSTKSESIFNGTASFGCH